jgi:hypothetical protein
MTYTAAQTAPLAARLVQDLPGLNLNVATVWINAESGGNNNPLGMTATRGSSAPVGQWIGANTYLVKYATPTAGIDAAAAHIKTSSYYTGIVASLSGNARQQALAIIASPWNAVGSPYYTRIFTAAGLLGGTGGATRPAPTVSVPTIPTVSLTSYSAATTARITALQGYIATLTKDVLANRIAGKTAAAATDQASLTKYQAELASLLATAPSVTLPSPTGLGGLAAGYPTAGNPLGLGTYTPTVPLPTTFLTGWGNLVSFPVGHKITATDVTTMMNALNAGGFFSGSDPITNAAAQAQVQQILTASIGQVWGKPLQDSLQAQFNTAAVSANPMNAIGGALGGIGTAIGAFGGTVTTVFTYLAVLIVLGLGIFIYSKGNNGQQQQGAPVAYPV